ncbi:MAG: adenylate kinase family protein [Candidatus Hermodarchaeota archaeon]
MKKKNNHNRRIYICGTPGTGKTTIAKIFSGKYKLKYIEINDLILEKDLYLGIDILRNSLIIDEELLTAHLDEVILSTPRLCLVGHPIMLSEPTKRIIDEIFLFRCSPEVLRKRLQERKYSRSKIEENIEAEIMDIVKEDAKEVFGRDIVEVDTTTQSIQETILFIQQVLERH